MSVYWKHFPAFLMTSQCTWCCLDLSCLLLSSAHLNANSWPKIVYTWAIKTIKKTLGDTWKILITIVLRAQNIVLTSNFDELNNRSLVNFKLSDFVGHFVDLNFWGICIPSIYLKWQREWICCKLIINKVTNIFLFKALHSLNFYSQPRAGAP